MCPISEHDQRTLLRRTMPGSFLFRMPRHTPTVIKTTAHDLQCPRQAKYFDQFPELINCTPRLPLASRLSPVIDITGKFRIVFAAGISGKIIQICIALFFQIRFLTAIVGIIISKFYVFLQLISCSFFLLFCFFFIIFVKQIHIHVSADPGNFSLAGILPADSLLRLKACLHSSIIICRVSGKPQVIGFQFCTQNILIPVYITINSDPVSCFFDIIQKNHRNLLDCLFSKFSLFLPFQIIEYRKIQCAPVKDCECFFCFF